MNLFKLAYEDVLNGKDYESTFAPEDFLHYVKTKCYTRGGEYFVCRIVELLNEAKHSDKVKFKSFVENLKVVDGRGIVIVYFENYKDIEKVFTEIGYYHPGYEYKMFVPVQKFISVFSKFYSNEENSLKNFNSISLGQDLECIIGINRKAMKEDEDFIDVLDNELKKYYEGMNILQNTYIEVNDEFSKELKTKGSIFYNVDFLKDDLFTNKFISAIKHHCFNDDIFKIFYDDMTDTIRKYNSEHVEDLDFRELLKCINKCDFEKYSDERIQRIIFNCWVCLNNSSIRWTEIFNKLDSLTEKKKNIFQKMLVKLKVKIRKWINLK